jgi:hypothetical protein
VLGTERCRIHLQEIVKYDEMVERLSIAKATGSLSSFIGTPVWELYLEGREAQIAIESSLSDALAAEGKGREKVIAGWRQKK